MHIMKHSYILSIAAALFLLSSCADLDLSPLSEGSSENWYHDDTEYIMSLNDLMRPDFFPFDEYPRDDDVYSRNAAESTKDGTMSSETGFVKTRWQVLYKGISRSLRILKHLETAAETTKITKENIDQYKGEAYFHLGYSYAMLATYFGDVVLDKEGMSLEESYRAERSPRQDVIDFAFECLNKAVELLPESYSGQLRPTKYIALAFKVRFALFFGDYESVIKDAETIMDANVYTLESNYQELFQKPYSPELIFFFQGNKDMRYFSNEMFNTVNNYITRQIGAQCNRGPSIQLVCSYLCTDGLPVDESPLYNPKNFWSNRDPRLAYTVQPFILKDDPDYDLYCYVRENDERFANLVSQGKEEYRDSLFANMFPQYVIYGYEYAPGPYDNLVLNVNTHKRVKNSDSKASNEHAAYQGFIMKKFVTDEWDMYNSLDKHSFNTFPYLRYAEILLSYAEAKNEIGQCTQDVLDKTVNQVRARAYNGSGLEYPRLMMTNQKTVRKMIRIERRMEFAFEGIRYRDLMRWRIAEKVFNTAEYELSRAWAANGTNWDGKDLSVLSEDFKVLLKNWDEGKYPIGGVPEIDESGLPDVAYMVDQKIQTVRYPYKFDADKNYLWPIPATDLLVNSNLTQNPNY